MRRLLFVAVGLVLAGAAQAQSISGPPEILEYGLGRFTVLDADQKTPLPATFRIARRSTTLSLLGTPPTPAVTNEMPLTSVQLIDDHSCVVTGQPGEYELWASVSVGGKGQFLVRAFRIVDLDPPLPPGPGPAPPGPNPPNPDPTPPRPTPQTPTEKVIMDWRHGLADAYRLVAKEVRSGSMTNVNMVGETVETRWTPYRKAVGDHLNDVSRPYHDASGVITDREGYAQLMELVAQALTN